MNVTAAKDLANDRQHEDILYTLIANVEEKERKYGYITETLNSFHWKKNLAHKTFCVQFVSADKKWRIIRKVSF